MRKTNPLDKLKTGKYFKLRLHIFTKELVSKPIIAIAFLTNDFTVIGAVSNLESSSRTDILDSKTCDCIISENLLLKGIIRLRIKIIDSNGAILYSCQDAGAIEISPGDATTLSHAGIVKIDATWA